MVVLGSVGVLCGDLLGASTCVVTDSLHVFNIRHRTKDMKLTLLTCLFHDSNPVSILLCTILTLYCLASFFLFFPLAEITPLYFASFVNLTLQNHSHNMQQEYPSGQSGLVLLAFPNLFFFNVTLSFLLIIESGKTLFVAKTTVWYILKKNESISDLSNTKSH